MSALRLSSFTDLLSILGRWSVWPNRFPKPVRQTGSWKPDSIGGINNAINRLMTRQRESFKENSSIACNHCLHAILTRERLYYHHRNHNYYVIIHLQLTLINNQWNNPFQMLTNQFQWLNTLNLITVEALTRKTFVCYQRPNKAGGQWPHTPLTNTWQTNDCWLLLLSSLRYFFLFILFGVKNSNERVRELFTTLTTDSFA